MKGRECASNGLLSPSALLVRQQNTTRKLGGICFVVREALLGARESILHRVGVNLPMTRTQSQ